MSQAQFICPSYVTWIRLGSGVSVSDTYRIRIRLGYAFSRIPKRWIRIGSDTCIRHVWDMYLRGKPWGERDERVRGGSAAAREPVASGWAASTARDADGGAGCGGGLEAGRGAGVGPEAGRWRMSRRRAAGWPPWRRGADGELLAAEAWRSAQARGGCGSWAAEGQRDRAGEQRESA